MSKYLFVVALVMTTTPACSLIANPNDHTGHERDSGIPGIDTGVHVDAAQADTGVDAPGPVDAGHDAYATPECTIPSDCGPAGVGGLVQCLNRRCVFCAVPTESTPREIRSGSGLRPYLSLGIRKRSTGPTLVLVGTMGTTAAQPATAYRVVIDQTADVTSAELTAAVDQSCSEAFTSLSSISFFPDDFPSSSTTTDLAVIAQGPAGGMITHLTWADTMGPITPEGFTCRTLDAPNDFLPTSTMLRAPSMDGSAMPIYQITREATDQPGYAFRAYSYPYASAVRYYGAFGGPHDAYAAMTSAGPFMIIGGDTLDHTVWWDPEDQTAGVGPVTTPDRTGDPSVVMLGTSTMANQLMHFVMAYPVANRVRFVNVDCQGLCSPVGDAADFTVDAVRATAARIGLVNDVPVVLTSEHLASNAEQVALRVLRATHNPFDAPDGSHAMVLDTTAAGDTVSDIQLAVVVTTSGTRYAATWMVTTAAGVSSVRVQTFNASCL